MEFDRKEMGRRVAVRRKALKIKQNVLADILEVNSTHLSSIEKGRVTPSLDLFIKICNELRVTPDYLLKGAMHSNNVPQNIMEYLCLCEESDIELVSQIVRLLAARANRENAEKNIEGIETVNIK